KQSGGDVAVRSAPGRGATFTVFLPRATRGPDAAPRAAATPPAKGRETVLLVEDEDAVRVLVRLVLGPQGYRVVEARNGNEALALAERHDGPIDLLISDVVMPGLSGPDLAGRLADRRPGLRVLFLSGYTEDEVLRRGVRGGAAAFLHK